MPKDLRWAAATLWAGPNTHIVHYPLRGWKLFNLVGDGRARERGRRPQRGGAARGGAAAVRAQLRQAAERSCACRRRFGAGCCASASRSTTGPRAGHAARRRRAPHAAVLRAGRRDGAGGCGVPRCCAVDEPDGDFAAAFQRYQQARLRARLARADLREPARPALPRRAAWRAWCATTCTRAGAATVTTTRSSGSTSPPSTYGGWRGRRRPV